MPKDSPRSDGAQSTLAPRMRRSFSASEMRPSHSMRWSSAKRRLQLLGVGTVAAHPEPRVGRQRRHGVEQDVEALAGLVAADEEHRGALGGPGFGLGVALDLDAVEHGRVGAAEVALGERGGVVGHGAAVVEAVGQPPDDGPQVAVGGAVAGGVERGDHGRAPHDQRGLGGTRGQGLVDVEQVEALVAERPDGAELGRRVGSDGRHRPVGRGGHAGAERRDPGVGRRAVARGQHPDVVAEPAQRAGQAEHLHLHAARQAQAVGADHPDPLHDSGPRASWAGAGATARGRAGSATRARRRAPA